MSSTLTQVFKSDDKELMASYEKIIKENIKLREESQKAHEETHQHGREQIDVFDSMTDAIKDQAQELLSMAAGWATVEKAIELVNEELERKIELQEKAAEAVHEAGSQRPNVLRNLGPISAEESHEFFEGLENIGAKRGMTETDLDTAANFALSASGGDRKRALSLLDTAAQAVPEGGGETLGQVARGIQQTSTISGHQDPMTNLGMLFSAQKISPIKDIENISNYAVPSALNLTAQGASPEEAFALFSTLARSSGDVEGRRTRTATTNLFEGIHKFFDPEEAEKRIRDQVEHQGSLGVGEEGDQGLQKRMQDFLGAKGMKGVGDAKDQVKLLKEQPELGREFISQEVQTFSKSVQPATFDREDEERRLKGDIDVRNNLKPGEEGDRSLDTAMETFLKSRGRSGEADYDSRRMALVDNPELYRGFLDEQLDQRQQQAAGGTQIGRQLRALQENDELHKQFLAGFSPEAQAKGADIELLKRGSQTAKNFETARTELEGTDYRQAAARQLDTIQNDPHVQRLRLSRLAEVGAEQIKTSNFRSSDAADSRNALGSTYDATESGFLEKWGNIFEYNLKTGWGSHDTFEQAQEQIGRRISDLRYQPFGAEGEIGEGLYYPDEKGGAVPATEETRAGHFDAQAYVRNTDPEANRQADIAEEMLKTMVKIHEVMVAQGHKQAAHHTENQAANRTNGARANAAKRLGKE